MSALQIKAQINALEVAYENQVALNLSSFEVEANTIAVIGHNGAGKSTLIKTILGLLKPRSGSLNLSSNAKLLKPQNDMAFCPESGSVFADISVEEYVRMWCRLKQRDPEYYRGEGAEIIEALQIRPLLKNLGRELSKGQRRRVQTAIGFLTSPKLFLFDEPFDGLDVQKTDELATLIERFKHKVAFIISSHRMEVVERLADKVVVLKNGGLAAHGSVSEVCAKLCPNSIIISGSQRPDAALDLLRNALPDSVVSRIGDEIKLAGDLLDRTEISKILSQASLNGVNFKAARPSLMEAMNYHLRGL